MAVIKTKNMYPQRDPNKGHNWELISDGWYCTECEIKLKTLSDVFPPCAEVLSMKKEDSDG